MAKGKAKTKEAAEVLNAIEAAENPQGKKVVEKYDFQAPKKFSRESIAMLDNIYASYARLVEAHLASMLRLNVEVRLRGIHEQKYGEFNSMLADNETLALATLTYGGEEQAAPLLVNVSNDVALVMIDRLLGGYGSAPERNFESFTDIELAIVEKINTYILPLMTEAWQNYFDLEFHYQRLRPNPRMVQDLSLDDSTAVVEMAVSIQDIPGRIFICIPDRALEFLFKSLEEKRKMAAKHDSKAREAIFQSISGGMLEVSVMLDETELMLEDLTAMQVGDIINLNKPVDDDAILLVEGTPWFTGELGVHRQRMAIRIKDPVKKA